MDQEKEKIKQLQQIIEANKQEIEQLNQEIARLRTLVREKLSHRQWNTDFAGGILPGQ